MSTVPHQAASSTGQPLANLLFDCTGADIILRSQDCFHFRVPKTSIVINSPILGELIGRNLDSTGDANDESSLPVVQLPESGKTLHCLLTFHFPVTPLVPSTPEGVMELLAAAQKYQMGIALTHIRGSIARESSLSTSLESTLRIYSLAQKHGLRQEALQSAHAIILKHSMTFEDLDSKLDIMPGASLYELWKYRESVLPILASGLAGFRTSCARGAITGLRCAKLSSSQIPSWLDDYIESIGKSPNLFDPAELNTTMARHLWNSSASGERELCKCASIPSQTIRDFWEALASIVHGSFEKAESALFLVQEREDLQAQINSASSPLEPPDVPDANLVIRSSDLVDFRVHKPLLAMASPFFKDLLSLPQPSDSEIVDGLPVVQLPETSELLNSLVSILYPIPTVMPNSYDKVLHLLAACQKYEMNSVQSSIRAEVKRGDFPSPMGAEAFRAYAIASAKDLLPEMENAARMTLDQPMTFEIFGEGLRLLAGWALRDLVNFRRRCRDNLVTCLDSYLQIQPPGPSNIWLGCPEVTNRGGYSYNEYGDYDQYGNYDQYGHYRQTHSVDLPNWLKQLLSRNQNGLKLQKLTNSLDIHSRIRGEYSAALQSHRTCNFCTGLHIMDGSTFCAELENKFAQACNKVRSYRGSTLAQLISPRNR